MPTKQCVRADEERLLARSPQKSTGRSEEETIGVLQTRAGDLPAKNHKLMSKHNDLELLELARTQTQRRHRERTPKQQIHQRNEQEQTPSSRMRTRPDSTVAKSPPTYPSIYQTDLRTPHVYSAGYVGGPGRAAVIAHRLPSGRLVTARAKLPWSSHVLRFNPTSQISITVQVRYPVNHPLACGAQTDEQPYGREYTASDESGRRCEVHARLGER